jgi:hypothetical protein
VHKKGTVGWQSALEIEFSNSLLERIAYLASHLHPAADGSPNVSGLRGLQSIWANEVNRRAGARRSGGIAFAEPEAHLSATSPKLASFLLFGPLPRIPRDHRCDYNR